MAGADYFLKIEGVAGESTDDQHQGEISLESWSWAETRPDGAGGGAGKVQMQDFHFVMPVSKASPKLLLACASGEHLRSARLTCRRAGASRQEFLTFTFSDVRVSAYQTGGPPASDLPPSDQVSLTYGKIEVEYREQRPDGTPGAATKAGWDLTRNQPL